MSDARERLIVALDHPTLAAALAQVDALGDLVTRYKIGLELFSAVGPTAVEALCSRGKRIFLDLKIHDIPETVARAVAAASAHGRGVDLLTVHASGGRAMLERAVAAAKQALNAPKILAVTVLTSLSAADLAADGQSLSLEDLVVKRAQLAESSGCDGVIASPQEIIAIRQVARADFLVVTPSVRPAGASSGDQKRVATAAEARARGSSAVVVGRPIRDAADPSAVARALLAELG